MDAIGDDELESALRDAFDAIATSDFRSIVSVASQLRATATGDDDPLRGLIAALEYHLVVDEAQRRGWGPFGPMIESGGTARPAPVDKMTADVLALWERAAGRSPWAPLTARFCDLLWEARYGDRAFEWAQRAIDAYVAAAADEVKEPIEATDGLRRALELARRINDPERANAVVQAAVKLIREALVADERMPGVSITLIEMLARLGDDEPPELDSLIDEAESKYGNDAWLLESILDLRARRADPGDRLGFRARQAEAFAELARQSQGLVKYAHFQHAIELAELHDLHALSDKLRGEVEAIPSDDLELKTISAEVEIPRTEVERFIQQFVGDDDLESALRRFGGHIPTGSPDENLDFVRQLMRDHPLQYLFSRLTIGPENSLLREGGQDTAEEQALLDREVQRALMFASFAVEILDRIRDRYGPLAAAGKWFQGGVIDAPTADRIGRALELYEAGDFDSAGCVLTPRLERIVRTIASAVGLTVTRSPDRHGRAGGVKGLGELLGALEGRLEETTRRYLRALLTEVTGVNLRNRIGHGLVDLVTQMETALLIHAACHLRLLGPRDAEPPVAD